MICLQSGGAIEGKIVELIGEYGALQMEQLQRYFSIEDTQMEKIIRKLVKKGRLVSDKENGYIKAFEQKTYDEGLAQCFWVVLDLTERLQEKVQGKVLIVLEDTEQIGKLQGINCIFCTVSREGEVRYYESSAVSTETESPA